MGRRVAVGVVFVAVVSALLGVSPAVAAWPFPDPSPLPILSDNVIAGAGAISYRVTATEGAQLTIEGAERDEGAWFVGAVEALWKTDAPGSSFVGVLAGWGNDTARVRVVSNTLGLHVDTEPTTGGPGMLGFLSTATLAAGTYDVVMGAGGEQGTIESLFRLRGDTGIALQAVTFGQSTVAGPARFNGLANVSAVGATAIVNGTVRVTANRLTGMFDPGTLIGSYRGPDGNQTPASTSFFLDAPHGAYDFNVLLGGELQPLVSPPFAVLADVTPA